jgi:P27 family predicted phage terminase small subunit
MQGRKPTPTALKKLAGNPGHRAFNHSEPTPKKVMPRPAAHLSEVERKKWRTLVKELYPLGLLTSIDIDSLAFYCVLFARWEKAERIVREKGEVIKTVNGNIIQNPYLSIANRSLEQMNKIAAEFGMTPSSRSRVKTESLDVDSELEQMLFGGMVKVGNKQNRPFLHS